MSRTANIAGLHSAIKRRAARDACGHAERLRIYHGLTYSQLFEEAQKADPTIGLAEFDDLLDEGDSGAVDA